MAAVTSTTGVTAEVLFRDIGNWLPDGYRLVVDTAPTSDALRLWMTYEMPDNVRLTRDARISQIALLQVPDPRAVIWDTVRTMKAQMDVAVEDARREAAARGDMVDASGWLTVTAGGTTYRVPAYGDIVEAPNPTAMRYYENARLDAMSLTAMPRFWGQGLDPKPPKAKKPPQPAEAEIRPKRKLNVAEIA